MDTGVIRIDGTLGENYRLMVTGEKRTDGQSGENDR